jgi:hypothetical protein
VKRFLTHFFLTVAFGACLPPPAAVARAPLGFKAAEVGNAGEAQPGHCAAVPMQVAASGSTDLHALVMFVPDTTKPFSSPANFP